MYMAIDLTKYLHLHIIYRHRLYFQQIEKSWKGDLFLKKWKQTATIRPGKFTHTISTI